MMNVQFAELAFNAWSEEIFIVGHARKLDSHCFGVFGIGGFVYITGFHYHYIPGTILLAIQHHATAGDQLHFGNDLVIVFGIAGTSWIQLIANFKVFG
jgi:hypothetical protein